MKVLAKGTAVKSVGRWWASEDPVRGWTSSSLVDIIVDLRQAEIKNLHQSDTNTVLEVILPVPTFDERTFGLKPGSTKLVINHGSLDDKDYLKWSSECFGEIQKKIRKAVDNLSILDRSREPARVFLTDFYHNLGADVVSVVFKDEVKE